MSEFGPGDPSREGANDRSFSDAVIKERAIKLFNTRGYAEDVTRLIGSYARGEEPGNQPPRGQGYPGWKDADFKLLHEIILELTAKKIEEAKVRSISDEDIQERAKIIFEDDSYEEGVLLGISIMANGVSVDDLRETQYTGWSDADLKFLRDAIKGLIAKKEELGNLKKITSELGANRKLDTKE